MQLWLAAEFLSLDCYHPKRSDFMSRWLSILLLAAIVWPSAWLVGDISGQPSTDGPKAPETPAKPKLSSVERSVAAALNWLARHQQPDGSWSTHDFRQVCKDDTCSGAGELRADSAATAAVVLTFLSADQTHKSKGPYRKNIYAGLYFLLKNQKTNGSLAEGMDSNLAGHSLATIAMCECYRLTKDPNVGASAQSALEFIAKSPLPEADAWQYRPGQAGDASIVVWQLLALVSGKEGGLEVDAKSYTGRANWLVDKALAAGSSDFAAAAAGLLAAQALGDKPDSPETTRLVGRLEVAMQKKNLSRDCVAWLFASKALRTTDGPVWKRWAEKLNERLLEEQIKQACAEGSWNPNEPAADVCGRDGGRVYVTAMSTISLEIYTRYLLWSKPAAEPEAAPPAADKTPER
jgi:hypothetical protein